MPRFTYTALTRDDREARGSVEAGDRKAALQVLDRQGLYPTEMEQTTSAPPEPPRSQEPAPPQPPESSEATTRLLCPHCKQKLAVDDDLAGEMLECPACGGTMLIPRGPGRDESPVRPRETEIPVPATPRPRPAPLPRPSPGPPVFRTPLTPPVNAPPDCQGDPAALPVSAYVRLQAGEQVVAQYYARKLTPKFRVLLFILGLILGVLPGLLYLLWYYLAARYHGVIALTERRLVYVEFGKGFSRRSCRTTSFDLRSIASIQCFTQHGIRRFLGLFVTREKKAFMLAVRSRFPVHLTVGGITAIASGLFAPANDSLRMTQEIGSRILELQRQLAAKEA
jgi:DNA-directed RNA polymerase subunit RPC12/RpoP